MDLVASVTEFVDVEGILKIIAVILFIHIHA